MTRPRPLLHLLCGKVCAGKSTLARRLAAENDAVLLAEDDWLATLFGDRMTSLQDYASCSARLRAAVGPHVVDLLDTGMPVVLDFAANTVEQRAWMAGLIERTGAPHRLHVLDVPDDLCLVRLRARNAAGTHPFAVSDAQFRAVTRHFVPPDPQEGFDIVVHRTID